MSPIRAILFDLDGTLLDTLEDIADSMNAVLARRGLYRGAAHGIFNRSTKRALRQVASGA